PAVPPQAPQGVIPPPPPTPEYQPAVPPLNPAPIGPPPTAPLPPISENAPAPPARLGTPETTPPVADAPPLANRIAPPPPLPMAPCPWTLKMTIVDGLTVMEARIGKEIQFRVVCEKLDLQTPRGCINAHGDVKISGSGLDGHCQHLLINWTDDRLLV